MTVLIRHATAWRIGSYWFGIREPRADVPEYYPPMQVTTGTVIDGKVVVEGVSLVEGSVVAVLSRELDEPLALSPEGEEELLAAIAEIERGEFVSAEELLASLRRYG